MNLNEIQKLVYEEYIKNGYRDSWTAIITLVKYDCVGVKQELIDEIQMKLDIAELGLICTEVSEAQELVRKGKYMPYDMLEECSDIIIRTLNFMSRIGFTDSEVGIIMKNNDNLKREKLHGKSV